MKLPVSLRSLVKSQRRLVYIHGRFVKKVGEQNIPGEYVCVSSFGGQNREYQQVGTAKCRYNCIRPEWRAARADITLHKKRVCAQPACNLRVVRACMCVSVRA